VRANPDERMRALERAFASGDRDAGLRLAAMQARFDPVLGAWTAWLAQPTQSHLNLLQDERQDFMEANGFPWAGPGGRAALWRGPALITVWREVDRWTGLGLAEDAHANGAQRGDHVMYGTGRTYLVEGQPRELDGLAWAAGHHAMIDNLHDMSEAELQDHTGNIDFVEQDDFVESYAADMYSKWINNASKAGAKTLEDLAEYMEDEFVGYLSTEHFDPANEEHERIKLKDTPLAVVLTAVNSGLRPLNA